MVGLPLHLWTGEILKKVGDSCGVFVALDEGTASKTDLLWARILVKMNSNVMPDSINLLAGARSYELQIWWEIRPTVAEVFTRSSRFVKVPTDPREEEDRDARTKGHMKPARAVKCHISRDGLSEVGNRSVLGNCGAVSKLTSGPRTWKVLKCGVSFKARAKKSFEFQNVLGIRGRKGKSKNSHLKDTLKERIGPHLEGVAAQGPGQTQGFSWAHVQQASRSKAPGPRGGNLILLYRKSARGGSGEKTAWRTLATLWLRSAKCLHLKKGASKRRPQFKTKDAARATI